MPQPHQIKYTESQCYACARWLGGSVASDQCGTAEHLVRHVRRVEGNIALGISVALVRDLGAVRAGSHVGAVGRVEFGDVGAVDGHHKNTGARPVIRKMIAWAVGDRA